MRVGRVLLAALSVAACSGPEVRESGKPSRAEAAGPRDSSPVTPVRRAAAESSKPAVGSSEASKRCAELWPLIEKAATEAGVEPALLVGLVRAESNFRNDARSPSGAVGLTQVMKATARAKNCGDLSDAYENLICGARVLASFLDYYQGDLILGLSGYNAGHGMPGAAREARELPQNMEYVETVLWARARFLFRGCDF